MVDNKSATAIIATLKAKFLDDIRTAITRQSDIAIITSADDKPCFLVSVSYKFSHFPHTASEDNSSRLSWIVRTDDLTFDGNEEF